MAQTTVAQFATELKLTPEVLLEQLSAAGVTKNGASEKLTEDDKALLLAYLQEAHGHKEEKKKITLTRNQTSEIKKAQLAMEQRNNEKKKREATKSRSWRSLCVVLALTCPRRARPPRARSSSTS